MLFRSLSDFASEDDGYSMDNITRENQKPYLTVTAEIDENANATLLSRKLQNKIDKYKAPGGYEVKLSGDATQTTDMLKQMGKALALGFMLIYLVMVAQFQSLKSPFIRNRKNKNAPHSHDCTHHNSLHECYGIFTGCRKCDAEGNGSGSCIWTALCNIDDPIYRSSHV